MTGRGDAARPGAGKMALIAAIEMGGGLAVMYAGKALAAFRQG